MGIFLLGLAASTLVPCGTHLPIPEVAAAGGLEHEDIIGVEGGGTDGHLEGLGVVLIGAVHVEEAGGGYGLRAACTRGATLVGQGQKVTTRATSSPTCPLSPQQPLAHRIHHHLALEDGHQVGWLLAHGDADLHGLIIKLLVQVDSVVGRSSQLVCTGMAALGRAAQGSATTTAPFPSWATLLALLLPWGHAWGQSPPQSGEVSMSLTPWVGDLGGLTCQR